MHQYVSVAWRYKGEETLSRTHATKDLDRAICGQFLPTHFHVVPANFGVQCRACASLNVPLEITEEELEALAASAVLRLRDDMKQRHGRECQCVTCVAIGVLYGIHCVALTVRKEGK